MAKRHFLMLAHSYKGTEHIGGWLASEKLDGQRAFWDGGVTRGEELDSIPWANTEKDARYLKRPTSTGLWTRYGKTIQAPGWFLDDLPAGVLLDGELYAGPGRFQFVRSVCSRLVGDARWREIEYHCFGMPAWEDVFAEGLIEVPNMCKYIPANVSAPISGYTYEHRAVGFDVERVWMEEVFERRARKYCYILPQQHLPYVGAEEAVSKMLVEVMGKGGEGVMLRHPTSPWKPERVKTLLKVKKFLDMEGTVIGYTTGRKTDRGSKLLGLMGALILQLPSGVRLELSGFTEAERRLTDANWAISHPGEEVPDWIEAQCFPRGSKVTFRYRELSDDGVPKEARYWRTV